MKTIAILMTMLLVFTAMPLVAAENDTVTDVSNATDVVENITEEDEVDAGVTPDSPFYGLERAMERISLALTANKAERARKSLRYAEERLSEVKEMIEKEKAEAAEKAQKGHDKLVNETEEIIDELETNGDEEMAEEAFEDIVELKLRAKTHSERVARVKNAILERKRAQNWSEEKLAHMEEVFGKIIAKAQEMEQKMAQKRENARTKMKVLSELSDEELAELEANIRERARERIRERVVDRQDRAKKARERIGLDDEDVQGIKDESNKSEDEIGKVRDDKDESETQGNQPGFLSNNPNQQ